MGYRLHTYPSVIRSAFKTTEQKTGHCN